MWFFFQTQKKLFVSFFHLLFFLDSMFRIKVADLVTPRASLENPRRSISLPLPSLVVVNGFPRKSCSYSKLPEEPIKLSVRKLDGSSFDVRVIKSATVAELKLAVQDVFSHMPKKGPGKISWRHVWGHFCLSYDGQKLVIDNDHIINYGIKDGDQLHFIRHVTSSCNLTKIQSKRSIVTRKQSYLSISSSKSSLESEQNDEEDDDNDNVEKARSWTRNDKNQSMIVQQECQFGHLWRGRYSYSRTSTVRRKGSSKGRVCQPGYDRSFSGNVWKLLQLWGTGKYSSKRT